MEIIGESDIEPLRSLKCATRRRGGRTNWVFGRTGIREKKQENCFYQKDEKNFIEITKRQGGEKKKKKESADCRVETLGEGGK